MGKENTARNEHRLFTSLKPNRGYESMLRAQNRAYNAAQVRLGERIEELERDLSEAWRWIECGREMVERYAEALTMSERDFRAALSGGERLLAENAAAVRRADEAEGKVADLTRLHDERDAIERARMAATESLARMREALEATQRFLDTYRGYAHTERLRDLVDAALAPSAPETIGQKSSRLRAETCPTCTRSIGEHLCPSAPEPTAAARTGEMWSAWPSKGEPEPTGGPEPQAAVMLVDEDGLPRWLSEHPADPSQRRYRYVPEIHVARLIAAAEASLRRELAEVREEWRKCREATAHEPTAATTGEQRWGAPPPPTQTDWKLVGATSLVLGATVTLFWLALRHAGRATH